MEDKNQQPKKNRWRGTFKKARLLQFDWLAKSIFRGHNHALYLCCFIICLCWWLIVFKCMWCV